jgi:hypothetical protein
VAACLTLTYVGGALEVAGFAAVAWQLGRVQRQEFGTPRPIQRARALLRRLLGRPPIVAFASLRSTGGGSATISGRVRQPYAATMEDRVAALEHNLGQLEQELDERTGKLKQELRALAQAQHDMRKALDHEHREREERRRKSLRESMTVQWWATGAFVIGAMLSVAGNAVTC